MIRFAIVNSCCRCAIMLDQNYFQEIFMDEHVYKTIELTGSSKVSMEDAVKKAISKASKTVHNMRWFQVVDSRGYIEDSEVSYWQVTLKIGFTVD
jgi:flavin-binding protein dodecin